MLAVAYAAAHPDTISGVVMVAPGTFDAVSRRHMNELIDERTTPSVRQKMADLVNQVPDPNQRLKMHAKLMEGAYCFDSVPVRSTEPFDAGSYKETWDDMVRLQAAGVYPAAFKAITCPVLMLHGAFDPHPGDLIAASLLPHISHLEYRMWERCGHYPWLERAVTKEFYSVLLAWLRDESAPLRRG